MVISFGAFSDLSNVQIFTHYAASRRLFKKGSEGLFQERISYWERVKAIVKGVLLGCVGFNYTYRVASKEAFLQAFKGSRICTEQAQGRHENQRVNARLVARATSPIRQSPALLREKRVNEIVLVAEAIWIASRQRQNFQVAITEPSALAFVVVKDLLALVDSDNSEIEILENQYPRELLAKIAKLWLQYRPSFVGELSAEARQSLQRIKAISADIESFRYLCTYFDIKASLKTVSGSLHFCEG